MINLAYNLGNCVSNTMLNHSAFSYGTFDYSTPKIKTDYNSFVSFSRRGSLKDPPNCALLEEP